MSDYEQALRAEIAADITALIGPENDAEDEAHNDVGQYRQAIFDLIGQAQ
jgi:hypothetical protein